MVAWIALILSITALGWDIWTYWLQSQRTEVTIVRVPPAHVRNHGIDPEAGIVMVTVEARGRVPVQVQGWAVVSSQDTSRAVYVGELARATNPDHAAFATSPENFPFVIQGPASGHFYIPIEPVEEAITKMVGVSLSDVRFQVLFGAKKPYTDRVSLADRLGGG